jgi:hypothetical protein
MSARHIPVRPDLDQLKNCQGFAGAIKRGHVGNRGASTHHPETRPPPQTADAQLTLALATAFEAGLAVQAARSLMQSGEMMPLNCEANPQTFVSAP